MAEIEMEVDINKSLGFDGHEDDDLIDFDTDMHDEHEQATLENDPPNPQPTEVAADVDEIDIDVENNEENIVQEADEEMSEEVDLVDVEETMQDVDHSEDDVDNTDEHNLFITENHGRQPVADDGDFVEISHDFHEDAHQPNNTDEGIKDSHEPDNEIDYEFDEQPEQPAQTSEAEKHELNQEHVLPTESGPAPKDIQTTDEHGGSESLGEGATADPEETRSSHSDDREADEEEEITYDEGGDDDHTLEETSARDGGDGTTPTGGAEISNDEPDEPHPKGESNDGEDEYSHEKPEDQATMQNEGAEHAEFDEYDVTADVAEEHAEEHAEEQIDDQVANESDHGPSLSGHNSVAASDSEFPAITVQYKGDEFPLFSNTSNGFFTETSVLDETIDKLLSGFREELANEICHEDELVFQVDELGLEFAESSWRDSLSSVTLRQILEIFDLLVKNQDPDSSRTLYTYLFTKPCATKRLESLIESATAGKGLDEVIHLFESPIPAGPSAFNTNPGDGPIDHSDLYDSPDGETLETNRESLELETQHGVIDDEDSDASAAHSHDDDEGEDEGEDEGVDEVDEAHEVDEDPTGTEYLESNDAEYEVENDMAPTQDVASDAAAVTEHDETNAHDESESNPFINLELNDEVEEDEIDLGADGILDDEIQADLDEANVGTANTSTTATLKDDDETASPLVHTSEDVAAIKSKDDEDELEEIDWRDEPQTHDDVPSPLSAIGKRARGDDDEVDAEDEQDVKRRRP